MKGIGIARIGLVAAGLTVAVFTTGASAQEGELVKNLLSNLGVIPSDKDAIEYRERAPLVLPPRMELREPAASGAAQARNPQWPNDPDVAARRRSEAEARTPITDSERHRMVNGNARLSIEEMRAGRRVGAGIPTAPVTRSEQDHWVHPDTLRAQERQVSASQTQIGGGEGTRRTLTDPPSAYRQSATGQPIKGSFHVEERIDEADPRSFHREQQRR
jgi:hypothetical protein